jgi:hypothetical protein
MSLGSVGPRYGRRVKVLVGFDCFLCPYKLE